MSLGLIFLRNILVKLFRIALDSQSCLISQLAGIIGLVPLGPTKHFKFQTKSYQQDLCNDFLTNQEGVVKYRTIGPGHRRPEKALGKANQLQEGGEGGWLQSSWAGLSGTAALYKRETKDKTEKVAWV